eukprot:CAMPEP_0202093470 /NCGR_PEP_ID=MMETSP0964-20121228/48559_1 /ASSEMBLY_ACC=CAM_ASM_000500 /TAXON_ID=4773 /ORGANISM="Schizochytrium aggregatum, Strain ATCC28209" /LENGTH=63 /DNA_ID=CAMNT_0048661721 /DNA_START=14 /DNA_END=206 /DNA_ORIENTATION=-
MIAEGCSNCAKTNKKNVIRTREGFKGTCDTCKLPVAAARFVSNLCEAPMCGAKAAAMAGTWIT